MFLFSEKPLTQLGTGVHVDNSTRGDTRVGVRQNFGAFETGWQPGLGINAGPHNPGKHSLYNPSSATFF